MDYLADLTDQLTLKHLFCIACGIAVIKLRHGILRPIQNWRSPLRNLQGPESNNLIFGHLEMLQEAQTGDIWEQWIDKYGKTFRWRRFFGAYELCTTDMRAINYVMSRDTMFPKSRRLRVALARILGEGLLSAEPEAHKRQRRIMNPSFNTPHIRNLVPIFWAKSNQLRDIWLERFLLIGILGFGYEFHSLEGKDEDELAKAFMSVFNSNDKKPSSIGLLFMIISHRLGIPTKVSLRLKANLATIRRIGMEIVEDKKKILYQNQGGDEFYGRDLLTLLIKSNIAPDIEKDQAMTDEEIFGPAGHETTSSTTSWALYALTKHPEVQTKLRQELLKAGLGDEPSMEELEKISYLDNFVREVLRVHAVVPLTSREADCDTVIPVGESYIDIHGNIQHGIRVQKGDSISIPILAMNRAKDVWGEDAVDFKPERWDNLPDGVKDMPGVWSHLMTFIHGPNACIGYRFAVIEVKALLYSLVRAFEFNIDPNLEIVGKTMLVSRPCVKGDSDNEYQVCIWDMRAINYVLSHNTVFPKSESMRRGLALLLGEGILAADEVAHKRQRRVMSPAFSALHIRNLLPIFIAKSNQLRDIWMDKLHDKPAGETIEVLSWLTRATLDIIGLAGFGYDFRSLEDEDKDELSKAYTELFNSNINISPFIIIKGLVCDFLGIPTEDSRRFKANQATVRRIGTELMKDKKGLLQGDSRSEESCGRDLLTLLIKSNLAETDNLRAMSDEEVLGQISTFLVAGHETTSSTIAWALYALTKHPKMQEKLRDELQNAGLGEEPSMDELDSLSYLDSFVREVLRVYAVVPTTGREVAQDTVIPVGESFRNSTGDPQMGIRVRKGDAVAIPVISINRSKEVWGEDAMEFNPDRWNSTPKAVKDMPGVWGHILTFLHGPHACIGFRFAVEEIKTLLYVLVRAFEFQIDPKIEIEGKTGLVTRPCVKGEIEKVNKLPLLCRPVNR
ncbi:unnamed protein product [Rhizoctonia solani]|uniref:Cytochrome P450 n=1 Tax=Rhizoctonia solani TaxID=456999 RepID=A0A8H2Y4A4_9AGAM|nr:unnamed protein product [Rhizoctonia solani]